LSRSSGVSVGEVGAFGWLRAMDPFLFVTALALTAFGMVAVYFAGTTPEQSYALAMNQGLGFAVGLAGAIPLAIVDYRKLRAYLKWIYGLVMFVLLAVMLTGASANGAQRWIDIGPIQVQPSEFAKVLMVIVLAGFFADNRAIDAKMFLKAVGIMALPALLVLQQPDLGTALVFGAVFFAVAFIGGAKLYQLAALAASGVAAFALAVKFKFLEDYQIARLTAFLDPAGSTDVGYQVLQSKTAIGSGGMTGKGLEATTLAKLGFLPEDHTDFIFSNLAERLGFVGSALLLVLFFVLIWRMLHVATISKDRFGVLIAVGIATIFLFHVFINVGMTMGIMPVTGIPLPFVSYGRSSLVVSVIALGLLQGIAVRSKLENVKGAIP
jgi:rod shape determining protein RodA